ncbi:MAG: bifunctional hydroxymethylpyrimidine kinase/phosphomethylpyrimidine kinase [Gammaproteobacteria bacterium]|nr:bifunctional hydroxymethylpyrimidine kinase/phosphomethylpyrimidine kinase [Gammaproteobacteria bacterium]
MQRQPHVPVVLAIAGSDPSGGAGIQADIEAITSMGCHAAPVITAVTVQDTCHVYGYTPMAAESVMEQARAVLEDMSVAAIKTGMLGSVATVEAVHTVLMDYPRTPLVVDPVLVAGGGESLSEQAVADALTALLFPLATVVTPNGHEARVLAPEADCLEACGMALLDHGPDFVLVTGGHEHEQTVVNRLFGNHRLLESFRWERLPGEYHGSGCTLASAIAGLLAQAQEPFSAIHQAQQYTWESLRHGYRLGHCQGLPNRLFWARTSEAE